MRAEDGALSTEYAGVLVMVGVLVVALVAVMPGVATTIADGIATAICRLAGEGCDPGGQALAYEPTDCVRSSEERSVGGTVKVTFVEVGGREGYSREVKSDGTTHVTWVGEGSVGATAGIGVKGDVELGGGGSLGAGASASGSIGVGGAIGSTWVFADSDEADAFIDYQTRQAVQRHAGAWSPSARLVGAVIDLFADEPDVGSPREVYFEAGASAGGEVVAEIGPAGVDGEGALAGVVGGKRDLETGETTLYVAVEGEVAGQAGVVLGRGGSEGGEAVLELTLGPDGEPVALRSTTVRSSGRGGALSGGGDLDSVARTIEALEAQFDAEATHRVAVSTELDLDDPANREAAMDLVVASGTAQLPGGASRLQAAADAYHARVEDEGRIGVTEYEGETWGLGGGGEIALGAKLGLDVGYEAADATLTDASYLGAPGPDGTRRLVAWTACRG